MDVSPKQLVSVAASLIPFLEHDDANRALMGSNMQRQAVPLLRTQRPYVGTGCRGRVAADSGVLVIAREAGKVASVSANRSSCRRTGEKPVREARRRMTTRIYFLRKFMRTNAGTCVNQKPIVKLGQKVKKGDVLADGPATDQGELALGRNVLVAFMPWCGYNFEDAILINERMVRRTSTRRCTSRSSSAAPATPSWARRKSPATSPMWARRPSRTSATTA
jgi:DNA-directed RNA polymerase subunit beta